MGLSLSKERKQRVFFQNKEQFKLNEIDYTIRFIEDSFFWNLYRKIRSPKKIIDPIWKKIPVPNGSVELSGYWAFPAYFKHVEQDLKSLDLKNRSESYKKQLSTIDFSNSCAIHVRRGDYLLKEYAHLFLIKDKEYYMQALEYLTKQTDIQKVYIFSNDIEWCRKELNLHKETVYGDELNGLSDTEELFLMSKFKNIIISNSTFSWWSAKIDQTTSKKNIITPKHWYALKEAQTAYAEFELLLLENSYLI